MQPPRSETISGAAASAHASEADASAKWTYRSVRRASFVSRYADGSNPSTSPATLTDRSSVGNCVLRRTPFRPEVMPFQKSSTPVPTGVTGPIPVTTTRVRWLMVRSRPPRSADAERGRDEGDRLADRLHRFHLFLRDLDAPLFFECEHGLDEVERIGVQVFLEPGVGDDLCLVHRELLGEHLLHPGLDLCTFGHRHVPPGSGSWLVSLSARRSIRRRRGSRCRSRTRLPRT